MSKTAPAPARRLDFHPGWIVPLMVLVFVLWDALARSRHLLEISAHYGVGVDAPRVDSRSRTGYEEGRRSLLLPSGAADAAHWVMQTQQMIDQGEARVRHVNYDNAPTGREVHWAAPFRWWLALMAWGDQSVSGQPAGIAIERATLVSGPVMLAVLFVGLVPLVCRNFSGVAAALVAFGAVAAYPFYTDFIPGRADHHGLANICGMLTVLLFVIGSFASRRRWFVGSAIAGGVGLWVSAATQVPVLIGLGMGIVGAAWLGRKCPQQIAWLRDPGLLRLWGRVGAGVSLGAYAIEYFPSHFGMRLEVNHPLYALAWLGAGETLRVVVLALRDGRHSMSTSTLAWGAAGAFAVAALPTIVIFTASKTFLVANPFLWRLHTTYIAEFLSLPRHLATEKSSPTWLGICLPVLLLAGPVTLLLRRTTPRDAKALLLLTAMPAALAWLLGWDQIRWLGLAFALTVPALAVFFRSLETMPTTRRRTISLWATAGSLLLVPGAIGAVQRTLAQGESTPVELRSLVQRDLAHWLRLRAGPAPVVVVSAPTATTQLVYHGSLTGVGTLYWENADGLRNASALFAASSPERAHELVRQLGVTHFVLFSWDSFEVVQAKLHRGIPESAPIPPDLFIANLLGAPVPPPWLRALPFKLPDHPALRGDQVRVWEVTAEQTPAEAAAHAANHYLEMGQFEIAGRFAPLLAGFENDLAASVMLAGIASRQQDRTAFTRALERVVAQLPRAASLSLDDHLHLVVVLTVAQQTRLAQEQLQRCMAKVTEPTLRRLSPGTLSDLLALSDAFEVALPTAETKALAQRLLPPSKRK